MPPKHRRGLQRPMPQSARMRHALLTNANGRWIAEAPGLLRCAAVGATRAEALHRLKDLIRRRVEHLEMEGDEIPDDQEVEAVLLAM
jgi:predicted RNase H-like HicB family nuclease